MGFFILEPNQYNLLNIFCKFHHHKLELSFPAPERGTKLGDGGGLTIIISNCCSEPGAQRLTLMFYLSGGTTFPSRYKTDE